jgi:hypothetical protein
MILLAFDGLTNADIAERLGCKRHAVGVWRRRWARAFDRLVRVECCEGLSVPATWRPPTPGARGGPHVSTDEMTGIQARERIAPTRPMRPGQT